MFLSDRLKMAIKAHKTTASRLLFQACEIIPQA